MAESTLTLGYLEFADETAFEYGTGNDFTAVSGYNSQGIHTGDALRIDKLVQRGYRQLLTSHSWNFLRPVKTIKVWPALPEVTGRVLSWVSNDSETFSTVVSTNSGAFQPTMVRQIIRTAKGDFTITNYIGSSSIRIDVNYADSGAWGTPGVWSMDAGNYGMPDDFGGIEHPLTEAIPTTFRRPIRITGSAQIREQRNFILDQTGYPQFAGITPRNDVKQVNTTPSPSVGPKVSRFDMWLWPIPEQIYTLRYRYIALMEKMTEANPYPIGGMMLSEVVMASCLAVAEFERSKERGARYADFIDKLATAIRYDEQAMATEYFGVMRSGRDGAISDGHGGQISLTVAGETII